MLLALAEHEDVEAACEQAKAVRRWSLFDRSWTPRDQEQFDRDRFFEQLETYANEGET
jgi:hypothetical protein